MLAEKNKDIKKAYGLLQLISKDEKARILYEARQAEISDQLTRIKSAEEKGIEKGSMEKAIKVAEKMIIKGLSMDDIAEITELTVEKLIQIKQNMVH